MVPPRAYVIPAMSNKVTNPAIIPVLDRQPIRVFLIADLFEQFLFEGVNPTRSSRMRASIGFNLRLKAYQSEKQVVSVCLCSFLAQQCGVVDCCPNVDESGCEEGHANGDVYRMPER